MSRYIDADALIRYGKCGTLVYWEDIENAPSIDIEPKRGEWIVHSNGKMCDCSVCNESYDRTFEYVDEWNFCPNCGADMRGTDDEV